MNEFITVDSIYFVGCSVVIVVVSEELSGFMDGWMDDFLTYGLWEGFAVNVKEPLFNF